MTEIVAMIITITDVRVMRGTKMQITRKMTQPVIAGSNAALVIGDALSVYYVSSEPYAEWTATVCVHFVYTDKRVYGKDRYVVVDIIREGCMGMAAYVKSMCTRQLLPREWCVNGKHRLPGIVDRPGDTKQTKVSLESDDVVWHVDQHHHVMNAPQMCTLVGVAPCTTLLNFDSHDDCGSGIVISNPADAMTGMRGGRLCPDIDIGTWILPAVIWGMFDKVVWVTKFARITPRVFSFCVFLDMENKVCVCPVDAEVQNVIPDEWISIWGDSVKDIAAPINAHICELTIVVSSGAASVVRNMQTPPKNDNWVISVDMDFFEVMNPVKLAWVDALRDRYSNEPQNGAGQMWDYIANISITQTSDVIAALKLMAHKPVYDLNAVAVYLVKMITDHPAPNVPLNVITPLRNIANATNAARTLPMCTDDVFSMLDNAYLADNPLTSEADLGTLREEFRQTLDAVNTDTILFPVLIASSHEYSNTPVTPSEEMSRKIVINWCTQKKNKMALAALPVTTPAPVQPAVARQIVPVSKRK